MNQIKGILLAIVLLSGSIFAPIPSFAQSTDGNEPFSYIYEILRQLFSSGDIEIITDESSIQDFTHHSTLLPIICGTSQSRLPPLSYLLCAKGTIARRRPPAALTSEVASALDRGATRRMLRKTVAICERHGSTALHRAFSKCVARDSMSCSSEAKHPFLAGPRDSPLRSGVESCRLLPATWRMKPPSPVTLERSEGSTPSLEILRLRTQNDIFMPMPFSYQ